MFSWEVGHVAVKMFTSYAVYSPYMKNDLCHGNWNLQGISMTEAGCSRSIAAN